MKPLEPSRYGVARLLPLGSVVLAVAACGGGKAASATSPQPPSSATVATVPEPPTVALEGCIVDKYFIPRFGTVHALSDDSRVVGSAAAGEGGRFTLRVPARQAVTVVVYKPGGESERVVVGDAPVVMRGCLRDEFL